MKRLLLPATLFVALWVSISPAQEAGLGDAAAPLTISQWYKGEPVQIEPGKVYVLEFWATWNTYCLRSIPYLTEMQKKFPEVIFIGITDEPAETVLPFIEKMGDQMDYRVARDGEDRETAGNYMVNYREGGIPITFVVDAEQRIVFRDPMDDELESTLAALQAGTFDFTAEQAKWKARQEAIDAFLVAWEDCCVRLNALLDGPPVPLDLSAIQAMLNEMVEVYFTFSTRNAPENASLDGERQNLKDYIPTAPLAKFMQDYMDAADEEGQTKYLAAIQQLLSDKTLIPAIAIFGVMCSFADTPPPPIETRKGIDLILAEELVARMDEIKEPLIQADAWDVYARVLHDNGRTAEALPIQERAAALAPENADIAERLSLYRALLQPAESE